MPKRISRRVRTEPVPGSDPTPQLPTRIERASEDDEKSWGDRPASSSSGSSGSSSPSGSSGSSANDEALRREKPPHY